MPASAAPAGSLCPWAQPPVAPRGLPCPPLWPIRSCGSHLPSVRCRVLSHSPSPGVGILSSPTGCRGDEANKPNHRSCHSQSKGEDVCTNRPLRPWGWVVSGEVQNDVWAERGKQETLVEGCRTVHFTDNAAFGSVQKPHMNLINRWPRCPPQFFPRTSAVRGCLRPHI